jgi:hypothetical protein
MSVRIFADDERKVVDATERARPDAAPVAGRSTVDGCTHEPPCISGRAHALRRIDECAAPTARAPVVEAPPKPANDDPIIAAVTPNMGASADPEPALLDDALASVATNMPLTDGEIERDRAERIAKAEAAAAPARAKDARMRAATAKRIESERARRGMPPDQPGESGAWWRGPHADVSWLPVSWRTDPLDAALDYAFHGLRVVPLNTATRLSTEKVKCSCKAGLDCGGSAGKHPRVTAWQKQATTDPEQVMVWFTQWPDAGVGLPMGGDQRLVALDIDGPEGRASLEALEREYGPLPQTLTNTSGREDGGEHRLFRVPEHLNLDAISNRASHFAEGLDVRASGGQIVVCPSQHATGRTYEWSRRVPVAELPEWLYAKMIAGSKKSVSTTDDAHDAADESDDARPNAPATSSPAPARAPDLTTAWGKAEARADRPRQEAWAEKALAGACAAIRGAGKGKRHDTLNAESYGVAGIVASELLDSQRAKAALQEAGRSLIGDSMSEAEVRKTIEDGWTAGLAASRTAPPAPPDDPPTPVSPPDAGESKPSSAAPTPAEAQKPRTAKARAATRHAEAEDAKTTLRDLAAKLTAAPPDDRRAIAVGAVGELARIVGRRLRSLAEVRDDLDGLLTAGELDDVVVAIKAAAAAIPPPEEERKQSAQEVLVEMVQGDCDLFHDDMGEAFATIREGKRTDTLPLKSKRFISWVLFRAMKELEKVPDKEDRLGALEKLEAIAIHEGEQRDVHVRCAEHEGKVYLDLANDPGEVVEIDATAWRIITDPPVAFWRPKGLLPLPRPVEGGSVDELRPLLNVGTDENFKLQIAFLLAALRARKPYPILVRQAEQGSGKSIGAEMCRALIDPNVAPVRATPRDGRDLAIAARAAHLLAFGNLSGVPDWLSDTLCRVSTGGGFSTRSLYTDDEERIFNYARPVMMDGIDSIATRGDLADRCIVQVQPPIAPADRKREKALWKDFARIAPRVLGALLTALSGSLAREDEVGATLRELPRLADFVIMATAAERALGWPDGSFADAYDRNRKGATQATLDADPVAGAVRTLLSTEERFEGEPTAVLAKLATVVSEAVRRGKSWPGAAHVLSNRLRRLAPALREIGVEMIDRDSRPKCIVLARTAAFVPLAVPVRSSAGYGWEWCILVADASIEERPLPDFAAYQAAKRAAAEKLAVSAPPAACAGCNGPLDSEGQCGRCHTG